MTHFKLKTKSIWGNPSPIYYSFLNKIKNIHLPKTICVLGCSDGKFVLPAAKHGFKVLAIDIDNVAIYGGKVVINNIEQYVEGMMSRLRKEHLEHMVQVVNQDYISYVPGKTYSGVFTSGSFHYQEDAGYPFSQVIENIKKYVSPHGLMLLEYIHKSASDNDPARHFVTAKELATYFTKPEWQITSNKAKEYVEEPNPRVPNIHKIIWGRLHATRIS